MSGDWSVLGFSEDPVRGDPAAARTAGQESQREAQRWEEQARSLRAVASEGGAVPMEGDFAPAARRSLQRHPGEASALARARREAGQALLAYAGQLEAAKRQSQTALSQGTQAKRSYDTAQQRYDQLAAQMRALPRTPTAAEYPAVMAQYNALNAQTQQAWQQMQQANTQLRTAQQRASQAGQQAAQQERTAANRVAVRPVVVGGGGGRSGVRPMVVGGGDGRRRTPPATLPGGAVRRTWPNNQPYMYDRELAAARKAGVRPMTPADAGFDRMIEQGRVKWVVDRNGNLRIVPDRTQDGTHPSHAVAAGSDREVLAAGTAVITGSNGRYTGGRIDEYSGHFQPSPESVAIARKIFEQYGITFP